MATVDSRGATCTRCVAGSVARARASDTSRPSAGSVTGCGTVNSVVNALSARKVGARLRAHALQVALQRLDLLVDLALLQGDLLLAAERVDGRLVHRRDQRGERLRIGRQACALTVAAGALEILLHDVGRAGLHVE